MLRYVEIRCYAEWKVVLREIEKTHVTKEEIVILVLICVIDGVSEMLREVEIVVGRFLWISHDS
jgi:hypothetical protein